MYLGISGEGIIRGHELKCIESDGVWLRRGQEGKKLRVYDLPNTFQLKNKSILAILQTNSALEIAISKIISKSHLVLTVYGYWTSLSWLPYFSQWYQHSTWTWPLNQLWVFLPYFSFILSVTHPIHTSIQQILSFFSNITSEYFLFLPTSTPVLVSYCCKQVGIFCCPTTIGYIFSFTVLRVSRGRFASFCNGLGSKLRFGSGTNWHHIFLTPPLGPEAI